jgi:hypothetical protein
VQTPDEIRNFLYACQSGDAIGVDLRGGLHVAGEFRSFDGEKLRLKPEKAPEASVSLGAIRRVIVEISSEGPE